MSVPAELVDYLQTLITPTHLSGSTFVALDLNAVDWAAIPDAEYRGVIAQGEPTLEQTKELWRIVKPGAHVMLISPEDQPTGHRGTIILEDNGFEIRDAILWVTEGGSIHYVPKSASKERNAGCEILASKRKGPPMYELQPDAVADEDLRAEIVEAMTYAGVAEDIIEGMLEVGIPKSAVPKNYSKNFKKKSASAQYGNYHPCLHPEALVMTAEGYRQIQEITIGTRVLSADGKFHLVEHVSQHPYMSPNLFEIEIQGSNLKTQASDNHPFLIWRPIRERRHVKGGKVMWVEAQEIEKGDYTLTPVLQETESPSEYSSEFWFLFGLYLAEGVLQQTHGTPLYPSYSLHQDEAHLISRIQNYFAPSTVSIYKKGTSKGVQVVAFDRKAGPLFDKLGGHGAANKTLHASIWNLPVECKKSLLQGYLAGDGGIVRELWRIKTVSSDLASQIQLLASSLGYTTGLYKYTIPPGKIGNRAFKKVLPYYQLYLNEKNLSLDEDPTKRKPSKPTCITHEGATYHLSYVKEVREIPYTGDVWNLSVEGSPTFQTAIGMSHNTVKPVSIMEKLLLDVPKDIGPVLDPFLGSGTTGLASLRTGHDFIGIEREADYLEIADARIHYADRAKLRAGVRIESDHKSEAFTVEQEGDIFELFEE